MVYGYIYDIVDNRALVSRLSKNDLKSRFAGSYLGVIWSFIQPVVTVCVSGGVQIIGCGKFIRRDSSFYIVVYSGTCSMVLLFRHMEYGNQCSA